MRLSNKGAHCVQPGDGFLPRLEDHKNMISVDA